MTRFKNLTEKEADKSETIHYTGLGLHLNVTRPLPIRQLEHSHAKCHRLSPKNLKWLDAPTADPPTLAVTEKICQCLVRIEHLI